jgi:hypothetical protein
MGWRGTLRSMAAAARRADRENQRRWKIATKQQMVAGAASAVAAWESYTESLSRISVEAADPIDWKLIAASDSPAKPTLTTTQRDAAQRILDGYKPSFLDIFYGGSERRRKKLEDAVRRATDADNAEFVNEEARYKENLAEWEDDTSTAKLVLKGDVSAYKKVIQTSQEISKDGLVGRSVKYLFADEFFHAVLAVHSTDIIPKVRPKQLASGRLSETKMPITQFNILYQSYVAGAAFKVASDIFRILPPNEFFVTCVATMLNTKTGHQEEAPILSIQFVRATFAQLDLANVNPTDALANFNCAMKFKQTIGFAPITPLKQIE